MKPPDGLGEPAEPDAAADPAPEPADHVDAVIVVAGGRSLRFGGDKLAVLLDRVLDGLPAAPGRLVCVGPRRPVRRAGVRWTVETPPGGGPLAAVAAGLADVRGDPAADDWIVAVVGGDMPDIGRAVPTLTRAARTADAAVLVDADGRPQPLASAWRVRALAERLTRIGDPAGRPLQQLLLGPAIVTVPDRWGAARDVDTRADLEGFDA